MEMCPSLSQLVPEKNPFPWFVLNALCFGSSLFMVLTSLYAEVDSHPRRFAKASYIVYDFATTIVWVVQVGLKAWWIRQGNNATPLSKKEMIILHAELALAVYFTLDSSIVLYDWKIKKVDIDVVLVAVLIGSAAYFFELVETGRDEWKQVMAKIRNRNTSDYDLIV